MHRLFNTPVRSDLLINRYIKYTYTLEFAVSHYTSDSFKKEVFGVFIPLIT